MCVRFVLCVIYVAGSLQVLGERKDVPFFFFMPCGWFLVALVEASFRTPSLTDRDSTSVSSEYGLARTCLGANMFRRDQAPKHRVSNGGAGVCAGERSDRSIS